MPREAHEYWLAEVGWIKALCAGSTSVYWMVDPLCLIRPTKLQSVVIARMKMYPVANIVHFGNMIAQ
jgi:hypothetical protein